MTSISTVTPFDTLHMFDGNILNIIKAYQEDETHTIEDVGYDWFNQNNLNSQDDDERWVYKLRGSEKSFTVRQIRTLWAYFYRAETGNFKRYTAMYPYLYLDFIFGGYDLTQYFNDARLDIFRHLFNLTKNSHLTQHTVYCRIRDVRFCIQNKKHEYLDLVLYHHLCRIHRPCERKELPAKLIREYPTVSYTSVDCLLVLQEWKKILNSYNV